MAQVIAIKKRRKKVSSLTGDTTSVRRAASAKKKGKKASGTKRPRKKTGTSYRSAPDVTTTGAFTLKVTRPDITITVS